MNGLEQLPNKPNKQPFYVRAKEITKEEVKKEMEEGDEELIIEKTRGKFLRLCPVAGEFLRSKEGNEEYPLLLRVKAKEGGYEILSEINEPIELSQKTDAKKSHIK